MKTASRATTIDGFDLDDNPEYAEATAKLRSLESQLGEARREWREMEEEHRLQRLDLHSPGQIHHQALDLLAGTNAEQLPDVGSLESKCIELGHRTQVLKHAVDLQRRAIEEARHKASKELRPAIQARYRELLRKLIFAYAAFAEAQGAETRFREDLDNRSIAFTASINPMPINLPNRLRGDGDWEQYVQEAVSSGYLSDAEAAQLTAIAKTNAA
jgi:hypothetical protein